MNHEQHAYPTLDKDIIEIEDLHRIRNDAYQYRELGLTQLAKSFGEHNSRWNSCDDEPTDLIYPSLLQLVLRRGFTQQIGKRELSNVEKEVARIFEVFENSQLNEISDLIIKGKSNITMSPEETRSSTETPIFQSCRLLQALLCKPRKEPPIGGFLAYYVVVRELVSVESPAFMMGAARARKGAVPTAFMTGECARALNSLARALEYTSLQFEKLLSLIDYAVYLWSAFKKLIQLV